MMAQAYHLMVDILAIPVASHHLLRIPIAALALVELIRESVGMEALGDPIAVYACGEGKAWGPGTSVLRMVTDSHLSLHCLEREAAAHFDLFSCRPLTEEQEYLVCQLLSGAFGGTLKKQVWYRST